MAKLTTDAIDSVTAKLQEFAAGLDPDEQTVVETILAKATIDDDAEVSGFNFNIPPAFNLGSPQFNLGTAQLNLRNGLVGRFCGEGGGPWELIITGGGGGDGGGGDDEMRRRGL